MGEALLECEVKRPKVEEVRYFPDGGMAIKITDEWGDGTSLPPIALNRWFYRWGDNEYVADADEVSLVCRGKGLEIIPK